MFRFHDCPDCSCKKYEVHRTGCRIERCSICRGERNRCTCPIHEAEKAKWTGELAQDEWKRLVLREGRRLLDAHGLEDWGVSVDSRPIRRLGQCRRIEKKIGISQCFIDARPSIDALHDLLLHEIAHALTPRGHDIVWKRKYAELLVKHFDGYRAADFLTLDRYCRTSVNQLLSELNVKLESTTVDLTCPTCGENQGNVQWSGDLWYWIEFSCGHKHTMFLEYPHAQLRFSPGFVKEASDGTLAG